MVAVVRAIRKFSARISGPPEDREKSYSRRADTERASGSKPTSPSSWMYGGGMVKTCSIFWPQKSMRIPHIEMILAAHYRTKDGRHPVVRKRTNSNCQVFGMRIGKPGAISNAYVPWCEGLIAHQNQDCASDIGLPTSIGIDVRSTHVYVIDFY